MMPLSMAIDFSAKTSARFACMSSCTMIMRPFLVTPPRLFTRCSCWMMQFSEISRMNSLNGMSLRNSYVTSEDEIEGGRLDNTSR